MNWLDALNHALTYEQNNKDRLTSLTLDGAHFFHGGLMTHESVKVANKAASHMRNGESLPEDDNG